MPRFYFHLKDRDCQVRDESGMALPSEEAAWYQAVRSARDFILADIHLGCSWRDRAVEIEDENGLPLDQLRLDEVAHYSV